MNRRKCDLNKLSYTEITAIINSTFYTNIAAFTR